MDKLRCHWRPKMQHYSFKTDRINKEKKMGKTGVDTKSHEH